ncbi:MAG: HAD hydrolase-like protein [Nostoc sp. TH1S01]|nr:HAD hydrolase-like protein [Nostoc sp. TH1S01]
MHQAILFDIDGTLTGILTGETFKKNPYDVIVLPGVEAGLKYYFHQVPGWLMIGISNQGGIDKGHKSIEDTIVEMKNTLELLPWLSAIYFCPDLQGLNCWKVTNDSVVKMTNQSVKGKNFSKKNKYRKPGAGMIFQASLDFGIDLAQSYMIGDRPEDEQAALAARVQFISAENWRNKFC